MEMPESAFGRERDNAPAQINGLVALEPVAEAQTLERAKQRNGRSVDRSGEELFAEPGLGRPEREIAIQPSRATERVERLLVASEPRERASQFVVRVRLLRRESHSFAKAGLGADVVRVRTVLQALAEVKPP